MEPVEVKNNIKEKTEAYNQLKEEVEKLFEHIEPKKIEAEIEELEEKLQQKEVWENQELSQKTSQELKEKKDLIALFESWHQNLADVEASFELYEEAKGIFLDNRCIKYNPRR